jgi:hypothetical protein
MKTEHLVQFYLIQSVTTIKIKKRLLTTKKRKQKQNKIIFLIFYFIA